MIRAARRASSPEGENRGAASAPGSSLPACLSGPPNVTPIGIRCRQERRYTVYSAQEVADLRKFPSQEELLQLNRYARWHFGLTFDKMVRQCQEMQNVEPAESGAS